MYICCIFSEHLFMRTPLEGYFCLLTLKNQQFSTEFLEAFDFSFLLHFYILCNIKSNLKCILTLFVMRDGEFYAAICASHFMDIFHFVEM